MKVLLTTFLTFAAFPAEDVSAKWAVAEHGRSDRGVEKYNPQTIVSFPTTSLRERLGTDAQPSPAPEGLPEKCLRHWQKGELDSVRVCLPSLYKQYKSSEAAKFFQAVFDDQGDSAVKTFETLAASDDPYAEESLIRLVQYQFARGLYIGARARFDELVRRYPRSRWITVGESLLGPADSARVAVSAEAKFAIQAGAFGVRTNAVEFQQKLTDLGYAPVSIREKIVNGKTLYAVRVGAYASRADAESAGRTMRSAHGIDNTIVDY
jgi:hypothetical protein